MASKSDWIGLSDVQAATNKVLADNDGDWAKINANMVAKELGKARANSTIYKHFDDIKFGRRFGPASTVPPPTSEQQETYTKFCLEIHNAAGALWMQDAERRVVGYREQADSAVNDRNVLLDALDQVEEERDALIAERDDLRNQLAEAAATIAENSAENRELKVKLEVQQADRDLFRRALASLGSPTRSMEPQSGTSTMADAVAALRSKDAGDHDGDLTTQTEPKRQRRSHPHLDATGAQLLPIPSEGQRGPALQRRDVQPPAILTERNRPVCRGEGHSLSPAGQLDPQTQRQQGKQERPLHHAFALRVLHEADLHADEWQTRPADRAGEVRSLNSFGRPRG